MVPQALQPVTGRTRQVMAMAGVGHVIPGLRQAMVALAGLGWWSRATAVP
jgi:hypothetical protein